METGNGEARDTAALRRRRRQVRRRSVIAGFAGLFVAPKRPSTQQAPPKIPRVGILAPAESDKTAFFDAFRAGLRDLGYVEGRNIILEFGLAHFDFALLPRLARELVNLPVDVIVTSSGAAARIAMEATREIPIVTIGVDPALFGLVGSLARPRANVTGFSLMTPELTAKRLEVLRTALPHISAVAVLLNPSNPPRRRICRQPRRRRGCSVCRSSPVSRWRASRPCSHFARPPLPLRTPW
jgi:putative ABC transport system substrate-binding protein